MSKRNRGERITLKTSYQSRLLELIESFKKCLVQCTSANNCTVETLFRSVRLFTACLTSPFGAELFIDSCYCDPQFSESKGNNGKMDRELFSAFLALKCQIHLTGTQHQMIWNLILPRETHNLANQEIELKDWLRVVEGTQFLTHFHNTCDDTLHGVSAEQLKHLSTKVWYGEKPPERESSVPMKSPGIRGGGMQQRLQL